MIAHLPGNVKGVLENSEERTEKSRRPVGGRRLKTAPGERDPAPLDADKQAAQAWAFRRFISGYHSLKAKISEKNREKGAMRMQFQNSRFAARYSLLSMSNYLPNNTQVGLFSTHPIKENI